MTPPIEDRQAELMIKALQQGQSARSVARIYGCNESTVRALVKSRGIALARGKGTVQRYTSVAVKLPEPIARALTDTARRRSMLTEKLAADIVTAITARSVVGSAPTLERTLELAEDYKNTRPEEADEGLNELDRVVGGAPSEGRR